MKKAYLVTLYLVVEDEAGQPVENWVDVAVRNVLTQGETVALLEVKEDK